MYSVSPALIVRHWPSICPVARLSFQLPLRSTSIRSLFLARLAQSCEGSRKGCALFYPDPRGVHQSVTHPASFQSLPHSLCVYPGWRLFRLYFLTSLRPYFSSVLTPLSATLAAGLRVLPCFGRNRPPATPLDATLTESTAVTPLAATLTKTRGRGPLLYACDSPQTLP
jgi:hypothetical protein